MAITCNAYVPKTAECADLSAVRREILAAAKRAAKAGRRERFEVVLPVGKHVLTKPFRLSAVDNPELTSLDITIRSLHPGMAEVNSLVRMDGKKFVQAEGKDYFTYDFIKEEGKAPLFRDFFLNFKYIEPARSRAWINPNAFSADEKAGKDIREGLWVPFDLAKQVAEAPIGATEIMMYIEWVFTILHVASVDLSKTYTEGGITYALVRLKDDEMEKFATTLSSNYNIGGRITFFRNAPAFLETNTYAYDYNAGVLYAKPENPEYTWCHAWEYPACETLFDIEGLSDLKIEGVSFFGTTSSRPCRDRYICGQANTIGGLDGERSGREKSAAILAKNVRNLSVTNCTFRDLGSNGVQVVDHSVGTTVKDCVFTNIGMCGVTVGNPTWEWGNEKNRTFAVRVENNYFRHIAYSYPAAPCIYIGQVDGLKILRNTVEDCGYSAVSVGWNWNPVSWELGERVNIRNAELAYNYFHNYMQLLKDGGAIYVLGSNCNHETTSERFNRMHDNFALLDERKNEYGKYGYYCDGSASNWDVYHSVVLNNERMPIFSQPHPHALSYHNRFTEIYSNTTPHVSTHVPSRDVVRINYVYDDVTPEEYFAKHPEAKRIADAAGSSLLI